MKSCLCGCGELIDDISKNRGEPKRFKRGHNTGGILNPSWSGGIHIDTQGYVNIKISSHRFSDAHGYIAYHRFVYESYHKCCLLPWVDIHHIDRNRLNNFPDNLQAMTHGQHTAMNKPHKKYKLW